MEAQLDGALFTLLALALRLVPAVALLPIFGGLKASPSVRSAALAVLCVATWPTALATPPQGLVAQATVLGAQLFVGFAVAVVAAWIMEVPRMVGGFADIALGRGSFGASDPLGSAVGPLSTMAGVCFVAVFMTLGGHRVWIAGVAESLARFPLDATLSAPGAAAYVDLAIDAAAAAFAASVALALPALCVGWIVDVSLGWLARTLPQLPVLFLSMPLRMLLGWWVFAASLVAVVMWTVDQVAMYHAAATAVLP